MRSTAYEKLLPPLVAKLRHEVHGWRARGYAGASATSCALLRQWFETGHLLEEADGVLSSFAYYFAQREAVETVVWVHEVRRARDKFDLLRRAARCARQRRRCEPSQYAARLNPNASRDDEPPWSTSAGENFLTIQRWENRRWTPMDANAES